MTTDGFSLLDVIAASGSRGMAGLGLGLLLADSVSGSRRRAIGWSMLLAGTAAAIPIAVRIWRRNQKVSNSALAIGAWIPP